MVLELYQALAAAIILSMLSSERVFMTLAGQPDAMEYGGKSFVTTLIGWIRHLSPIVTPE